MAVRLHEDEHPAGHDDARPRSVRGARAGRWPRRNGYTAEQSSDLYITDGDQIDWLYGDHRIFSFTYELYPSEQPRSGRPLPGRMKILAQTARNSSARSSTSSSRPAAPSAALGPRPARRLRRLVRRPRDQPWLDGRTPQGTDTATDGPWRVVNPAATTQRAQAAGHDDVAARGRSSPA